MKFFHHPGQSGHAASGRRDDSLSFQGSLERLEERRLLTTWTVDTVLDDVSGVADGFISLREAVIAAETNAAFGDAAAGSGDGDVIDFGATVAGETITLAHGAFSLTDDLAISNPSDVTIDANGLSNIFSILGDEDFTFVGLSLINGDANEGGAIYHSGNGTLTLRDLAFANNTADLGGAIFNEGGTVVASELTLTGNAATGVSGSGGAIYHSAGGFELTTSTIVMNSASVSGGGIEVAGGDFTMLGGELRQNTAGLPLAPEIGTGGALNVSSGASRVLLETVIVDGNSANVSGGAFWNAAGSDLLIYNSSVVSGNTAHGGGPDQGGGGIFNHGGLVRVQDSTVSGNRALGDGASGGGLLSTGGVLNVRRSTISQNMADLNGGAVEVAGGYFRIDDSLVGGPLESDGNVAGLNLQPGVSRGNGGGIHVSGSDVFVDVVGTSIRNNTANQDGGGLWNQAGSRVWLRNDFRILDNVVASTGSNIGGGGIFNNGGVIVIGTGRITRNAVVGSEGRGGGIYSDGGSLEITGALIAENTVGHDGGGIYSVDTFLRVTTSTLRQNLAGNHGGGLATQGTASNVRIADSEIIQNEAADAGGGIYNTGGRLVIADGSFVRINSATVGGGIYTIGGLTRILDSTVTANRAVEGGGIYSTSDTLNIRRSVIRSNLANVRGGGLAILGGAAYLRQTTVGGSAPGHGNVAGESGQAGGLGGGIYVSNGSYLSLGTSTVTANVALSQGGGIWSDTRVDLFAGTSVNSNYAVEGGGLYNAGVAAINDSSFNNNLAGTLGGGLYVAVGGLTFVDTPSWTGNSASLQGGGGYNAGELHLFDNGEILDNSAGVSGGGLFTDLSTGLSFLGSTFFGNNTPDDHAF